MPRYRFRHIRLPRLTAFRQAALQHANALMKRVTNSVVPLAPVLLLIGLLAAALYLLAVVMEPAAWLPTASEAHKVLGILLGAQAAIAALTLAVTLFVMQGVSARRDVDDRIYVEYVRRSRVRLIFWSSVGSVALTGAVMMLETFAGDTGPVARVAPGIPNLALMAVAAFAANLACAGLLFEQAIRLAKPDNWRKLRLDVNKRDVREAVRVFLGRYQRAIFAHETNEPDLTVIFPDPGEGSADEAIRALLDDARRAMIERRQLEFKSSLESITELVTYAMDEMERAAIPWSEPGSQPEWPPLRELGHNLFSFREEVIREGNRECVFELRSLDHWLVRTGLARECGELFSSGLTGYRSNYQIAVRRGIGELHEMLRDDFAQILNGLVFRREPEKLFPFMLDINRHQERILSDALHANRPDDYAKLHQSFCAASSNVLRHWRMERREAPQVGQLWNTLVQQQRIALMGLAGRAVTLETADRVPDAGPYLAVAREAYRDAGTLAEDISAAIRFQPGMVLSQWADWEFEDAPDGEAVSLSTDKYPLTFFAVRLMELLDSPDANLNLHGDARRVLDWFIENAERLQPLALVGPDAAVDGRRELATNVLYEAVRRDELEEDYETIRREISAEKVAEFAVDIRAGAATSNYVERIFRRAGAVEWFNAESGKTIAERSFAAPLGKRYLMDAAEDDKSGYALIGGEQRGHRMSFDAVELLCEELEGATPMTALLGSRDALLRAIDLAIHDLGPVDDVAIVVAGDWGNVTVALRIGDAEHYVSAWHLDEETRLADMGTYRGYPVLAGPSGGARRLYVIEPRKWGMFERQRYPNGHDVRVGVELITPERAHELLQKYPKNFSQEPDDDAKMRKWQTYVEVIISTRHAFVISDPSRARKITEGHAAI